MGPFLYIAVMRHVLTNIDEEKKTATCSVCGDVKIAIRDKNSKTKSKWRCIFRKREMGRRRYVSLETYREKRKDKECEICGKTVTENKKDLAIDHCHTTGKIRGVLCDSCNLGLGKFKDDLTLLSAAVEYLKKYRE